MAVFTIPFNYDETVDRFTVPICISDTDEQGNSVHFGWIERGVAPVADKLVQLAGRMLHDKWRASEITEPVVHRISREFGADLGDEPSVRVFHRAQWYAEDLRVGGRRARRKTDVELFIHTFEALEDQFDLANSVAAQNTLNRLMDQLTELGLDDVREMVPMMLMECDAHEFRQRFKKSRNAVTQQFYRGMRKKRPQRSDRGAMLQAPSRNGSNRRKSPGGTLSCESIGHRRATSRC